jgi:hypothetical protein
MRWLAVCALAVVALGCAGNECDFHSHCGSLRYCERGRCYQDCRQDFDCMSGEVCDELGRCVPPYDAGPEDDAGPSDAGTRRDAGVDAGPRDSGVDGGVDAGPRDSGVDSGPRDSGVDTGVDSGPPVGTGRYLDRCSADAGCMSGRCVDDVGGTRMCTITCATHRDCASEHVCASGVCRHDDTGTTCSTSSPTACVLGLCVGNSTTGVGECTRECNTAADCPSGFACGDAGGTRVCVDIEHGCSGASQCATGLCLSIGGCTAECRTAADCPRRFDFLPQYTCQIAAGSTNAICVPPADILGSDPIGASCPFGPVANSCRSGGCDDAAPLGPMCTQSCTQEGGCGPGLGCWPSIDGAGVTLFCSRAGTRPIGGPCGTGRECDSGLCDTAGYCTRLCTDDGLCPTGMRCDPVPGYPISICRR